MFRCVNVFELFYNDSWIMNCVFDVTQATSEGFKRKSRYYEAGVCAQLIMAAPMVPQFTSELWEG